MTLLVQNQLKLRTHSTISLLPLLQKLTKESIKYSHKHFSNFLKNRSHYSFFLSPTNKYKIINIISSLDSNKSIGPNSIPTKILKLLKNDISTQLSDIFNVSFSIGVFPFILKIAKVIPIHK